MVDLGGVMALVFSGFVSRRASAVGGEELKESGSFLLERCDGAVQRGDALVRLRIFRIVESCQRP